MKAGSKWLPFPIRKSIDFVAVAITLERRQPQPALATSRERRRPVRMGGVRVPGERRRTWSRPTSGDPRFDPRSQRLHGDENCRHIAEHKVSLKVLQAFGWQDLALHAGSE